jgi:hypothetical protein
MTRELKTLVMFVAWHCLLFAHIDGLASHSHAPLDFLLAA